MHSKYDLPLAGREDVLPKHNVYMLQVRTPCSEGRSQLSLEPRSTEVLHECAQSLLEWMEGERKKEVYDGA